MTPTRFPPTRAEALRRMEDFVPRSGRDYAALRNYDLSDEGHPHVSRLSPYIRHRMVTEPEVLAAVLDHFRPSTAQKFVQEVFWRTYWKGWLEMRPGVWESYRQELQGALNRVQTESGLRAEWEAACGGDTGIDAFDHWAHELRETGYLHNHARMWFASIWIFTLRLPWTLGADFFLRHLLDGDPASNTLGWRWVAGLQTHGKTYLARPSNIARYTRDRFRPEGQLAPEAPALDGPPHPSRQAAPEGDDPVRDVPTGLLLTEDDLSPGFVLDRIETAPATAVLLGMEGRSPLTVAPMVAEFTRAAAADALERHADRLGPIGPVAAGEDGVEAIVDWAREAGLAQVVAPYAPAGPAAAQLAALGRRLEREGIALRRVLRDFDRQAWPHATHGFFRFKEAIPSLLADLGLDARGKAA